MLRASEVERKLLAKIDQALEDGELKPQDLATNLRNVTTTKALNNDKIAAPIRGRPSVITETRTADELVRKLEQLGVIDSTAEEIPHPQLQAPTGTEKRS